MRRTLDMPAFALMPVNHVGQLASGASIQPFRTVQGYESWLERVDDYVVWVDTAIANMRIGLEARRRPALENAGRVAGCQALERGAELAHGPRGGRRAR